MQIWLLSWQEEKQEAEGRYMEAKMYDSVNDLWKSSCLCVTDVFEVPPVMLKVDDSIVGTLGNFSASTGKAKSKKTFNVTAIVAAALINGTVLRYSASLPEGKRNILYVDTEQSPFHCKRVLHRILQLADLPQDVHPQELVFLSLRRFTPSIRLSFIDQAIQALDHLGLVVIDGIRDLAYDINSPSEATNLITKLMQWTDERQIHIHTVLHLNKGDDNTRGHLGTELNNKAETILMVTKDGVDGDVSAVSSMCIRDMDFEPFAFRVNEDSLPVLVDGYALKRSYARKVFDFQELSIQKHREVLSNLFVGKEHLGFAYSELIVALRKHYGDRGYVLGEGRVKQLKMFLENKGMLVKVNKCYCLQAEGGN